MSRVKKIITLVCDENKFRFTYIAKFTEDSLIDDICNAAPSANFTDKQVFEMMQGLTVIGSDNKKYFFSFDIE